MSVVRSTHGDKLYFHESGIELKLKSERTTRKIFSFNSGAIVKRVLKKNIMKVNDSIGFNYEALKVLRDKYPKYKYIYVVIGKKKYKVPISEIITNGSFLHFKEVGFELQIFYKVEDLEQWA